MTTQQDLFSVRKGATPYTTAYVPAVNRATSIEAARTVRDAEDQEATVLAILRASLDGLTDEEIYAAYGGPAKESSIRRARVMLWHKVLVSETYVDNRGTVETRISKSGRRATVWRAV